MSEHDGFLFEVGSAVDVLLEGEGHVLEWRWVDFLVLGRQEETDALNGAVGERADGGLVVASAVYLVGEVRGVSAEVELFLHPAEGKEDFLQVAVSFLLSYR